jgi:hypothetical protein
MMMEMVERMSRTMKRLLQFVSTTSIDSISCSLCVARRSMSSPHLISPLIIAHCLWYLVLPCQASQTNDPSLNTPINNHLWGLARRLERIFPHALAILCTPLTTLTQLLAHSDLFQRH